MHKCDTISSLQDVSCVYCPEVAPFITCRCNLITSLSIYKVGSTSHFKPAGSMLRNLFGYHVPSDLLLLKHVNKRYTWFIRSIQVFKTMNGLHHFDPEMFFLRAEGRCTMGHKNKLLVRHSRLEVRKNVFSQRIVQNCGHYPHYI